MMGHDMCFFIIMNDESEKGNELFWRKSHSGANSGKIWLEYQSMAIYKSSLIFWDGVLTLHVIIPCRY